MKKRRPRGASLIFALPKRVTVGMWMRVDNVNSQNYFSIRECEKEKEVKKYGMGTNEHQSF
jgi:hypothetical protein